MPALQWISGFFTRNMLSCILLGGLVVIRYANRDSELPALGTLRWIIAATVGAMLAKHIGDWAGDQGAAYNNLRYAMSMIEYTLTPVIILLELLVIVEPPRHKRVMMIPALINAALVGTAPWTRGLVFYFSEDGHYHRGPLSAVPYVAAFVYLVLLLIQSLRYFREGSRKKGIIVVYIFHNPDKFVAQNTVIAHITFCYFKICVTNTCHSDPYKCFTFFRYRFRIIVIKS